MSGRDTAGRRFFATTARIPLDASVSKVCIKGPFQELLKGDQRDTQPTFFLVICLTFVLQGPFPVAKLFSTFSTLSTLSTYSNDLL